MIIAVLKSLKLYSFLLRMNLNGPNLSKEVEKCGYYSRYTMGLVIALFSAPRPGAEEP